MQGNMGSDFQLAEDQQKAVLTGSAALRLPEHRFAHIGVICAQFEDAPYPGAVVARVIEEVI
ncbi:hypothetical protein D3C76_1693040 [compost metagenome]